MQKRILLAATALSCCIALTGCNGGLDDTSTVMKSAVSSFSPSTNSYDYATDSVTEMASASYDAEGDSGSSSASETNPTVNEESKKIYTGNIEMETTEFTPVYNSIQQAVKMQDAWLESDYTGTYGIDNASYASLTIRVPVDNFDGLIEGLEGISGITITSKSISTEDVSEDYYDIEGRLENAQAKLKNLQKLSEEAENVSDMLTIEDSISDVQYTIEYLQGQINRYDSRISYSTVYVRLDEVNVMTGHEEGYGNRLFASLRSGFFDGIDFLGDVILWIAQNWLVLLVVIVIIIGLHKWRRKRKVKKTAKREAQQAVTMLSGQEVVETPENTTKNYKSN